MPPWEPRWAAPARRLYGRASVGRRHVVCENQHAAHQLLACSAVTRRPHLEARYWLTEKGLAAAR